MTPTRRLPVAAFVALATLTLAAAKPPIKFTETTLPNGLRVIISCLLYTSDAADE